MSQPLQKNLSLYRGDSTSYDFTISDIDPLDYDSISIRIAANRSTDGKTVINKQILSSDTGNDWALSKVRVNLTPAESQTIQVDRSTILSYDIEVTRTLGLVTTVITEWAGEIVLTEDTTIGNPVITPDTELNIYSNLASNDGTLGASLVGVATTIWSTILSLGNRTVQKALEWLLNNKLNIPSSHTVNRLIKLGTATPSTEITGITVTSDNDVTGARFVTGSATPTDASHLTRKDYVDGIPEAYLDSLGGSIGQVVTKTISGYDMETPPSADVEAYLDALGGGNGDVLTKDPSGYIFDAPGGVEAYLDSLGGSDGDVLTKTSGGYDMEPPTSTDSNALGSYVQDDFGLLDSSKYKPADASSINRSDVNSSLLAKLLKSVTSLTSGTDRVNIVGHGLSDGQKVKFGFSGGGITALTEYYVRNKTTDDFQLSTTPSGGILDLTSDQTGEMLTNVAWGFGNGSTTLNTPDLNGKFLRAAGVSTTFTKANGSAFDGGAVGESILDKFQGHNREFLSGGSSSSQAIHATSYGLNGSNAVDGSRPRYYNNDASGDNRSRIVANSSDGTPRTGDETAPVSIAVKLKVRIA